jgi:hypothetical protein
MLSWERTVGEVAGELPLDCSLQGQLDVGGGILVLPLKVLHAATGRAGRGEASRYMQ